MHEHEHEHTHTYTHSHPHEHEEGHENEHTHTHEHEHHHHDHDHGDIPPSERTKALLGYMIDHNEHHAEELAELVDSLEGPARKKLLEAIGSFEAGNVQLREVLELVKGEA